MRSDALWEDAHSSSGSGGALTSVSTTCSEQECADSSIDVVDHQTLSGEDSAGTKRNINLFCNWEKLRPRMQRACLEENFLKDDQICVVCLVHPALIRCSYCGPRQYLCETCAYSLHEKRNQFHVMEKWTVSGTFTIIFILILWKFSGSPVFRSAANVWIRFCTCFVQLERLQFT